MRACCALAGGAALTAAWLGPLPPLAADLFAAYSAAHVAVICVVTPLLAVAVAGSRFDPVKRWPRGFSPLAAALIEMLVVWGWHAPAIFALREASALAALQQASFAAAGLVLWLSVLGGDGETRYERAGVGIIALLLTSMHMTLLGVLAMISAPLFSGAVDVAASMEDQRLGGLLILAGAGIIYLIAGLVLLAWLLRPGADVSRARRPA